MSPELRRRRVAASASVAGLAGALAYVVERGWFHLVVGTHGATIVLREQRVNYHLALVIAGWAALATGLLVADLARTEGRIDAIERVTERAALPALVVLSALVFLWP